MPDAPGSSAVVAINATRNPARSTHRASDHIQRPADPDLHLPNAYFSCLGKPTNLDSLLLAVSCIGGQSAMHYKGYEVSPAAQALTGGLFAANLVIQDEVSLLKPAFVFDALDYFFESDLALAYAARWARMWIDNRPLRRA
jgi:hypothetical protein